AVHGGGGGGEGGQAGDAVLQRSAADVGVVEERLLAERRVDDQRDLAVDQAVDDVGALVLVHFPGEAGGDAVVLEEFAGAHGGDDLESEVREIARQVDHDRTLVVVVDGDE